MDTQKFWYRIKKDTSYEEAFSHLIAILQNDGLPHEAIMGRGCKRLFRDPAMTAEEFAAQWVDASNPHAEIGCLWDGEGWVFFGKLQASS
jgi:hypothetical protein